MELITRIEKGSRLTYEEMDNNLIDLSTEISIESIRSLSTETVLSSEISSEISRSLSTERILSTSIINIPKNLVMVTYSQLKTLKDISELIPTQKYLLTDYMTEWDDSFINPNENPVHFTSGVVEPLIIEALASDKLNMTCSSQLYPQDIIYYDIDDNTEGFTKGKIFRRIDIKQNNDIGTDWRHITYRRWKIDVITNWTNGTVYNIGDFVKDGADIYMCNNDTNVWDINRLNFILLGFKNGDYVGVFDVSHFGEVCVIYYNTKDDLYYKIPCSEDYVDRIFLSQYNTTMTNNTIKTYSLLNSIVIGGVFYTNNIEGNFKSNTIGDNFGSNNIKDDFKSNIIGDGFNSNIIGNSFNSNIIGNSFNSNITGNVFNTNTIGYNFQYNTVGYIFRYNTIVNNFQSNIIENGFESVNFTNSTYVYMNFNKELYKTETNSKYLKYYNDNNVLVTVFADE